jgi:ATP-GRASP peptide maturase of grasp-with-spasm system
MILIISNDDDISTQKVCKWLNYYNQPYVLITNSNRITNLNIIDLVNNNITITVNNIEINLSDIKNVWYRRGKLLFTDKLVFTKQNFLFDKLKQEWEVINIYLMNYFKQDNYFNNKPNKLIVLKIANDLGFKVPLSILTTSKKVLQLSFLKKRVISKPVNEVIYFNDEENVYSSLTIEVVIDKLEKEFPLSFFQELIEKKYEIRVFYHNGMFFASAIFSQEDEKTQIDYRNYNYKKLNKQVPYKLSYSLEEKIENLMKSLSLSSGSIDLIKAIDDNYYFLEVNPIGQFDNLSMICNYNIEKVIARSLFI